ncbi:hypothetical protein T484DRAFT_1796995 [Baffinella frigidus]|nr:hypothetical protein T484DRAFT_1796995 [Cryptophyta sp. CCMP2293]
MGEDDAESDELRHKRPRRTAVLEDSDGDVENKEGRRRRVVQDDDSEEEEEEGVEDEEDEEMEEAAEAGIFVVSTIAGCKRLNGVLHYKVTWAGYGSEDDSWEPASTLSEDIPEALDDYRRRVACGPPAPMAGAASSRDDEKEDDEDEEAEEEERLPRGERERGERHHTKAGGDGGLQRSGETSRAGKRGEPAGGGAGPSSNKEPRHKKVRRQSRKKKGRLSKLIAQLERNEYPDEKVDCRGEGVALGRPGVLAKLCRAVVNNPRSVQLDLKTCVISDTGCHVIA